MKILFTKLISVEGFLSVKDKCNRTGFPLGGGNDRGGAFFLFLSFLRKQESSFLLEGLTTKTI
ncbi:hypothetical protein [Candidatus Magnetomonas plexicatena]|uniref:hypothetical protein n=1 Tax=Candidatus Magnetomonas plexicatena TaxID=2552947 RepID=UPI001C793FC4|nr:hypothetical protein E2O03_015550 [Nitrospirales bacterium LBB_01]